MTQVILNTTLGAIKLELNAEKAPLTVANFVEYVKSGHYNGKIFHRVINDFMIQGGGMDVNMKESNTRNQIKNEANNGLKNDKYTIAMARTPDPDSASSQFFINLVDNDFLNFKSETPQGWGYAVFGKVTEGMDVVDAIAAAKTGVQTGMPDVPVEAVVMKKVTVLE